MDTEIHIFVTYHHGYSYFLDHFQCVFIILEYFILYQTYCYLYIILYKQPPGILKYAAAPVSSKE